MAVINRIGEYFDEMQGWRRHLHAHPELCLDCPETAAFVVARLREFGITEIHTGIATSGIVAIINGQGDGPTIGLRADMDALPMQEETGLDYASKTPGKMHACGHDGHTTMLLGAAKYLSETRNFSGRVALIFQPAEETIGGARIMLEEGILDDFNISQVFAMHSLPGIPLGHIHSCTGPILAAVDDFEIVIKGTGGHAASPHETIDPVMIAVQLAQSLQTIVTRNTDPIETLVLSITQINTGSANNVIPVTASLQGTVRSFSKDLRAMVMQRMETMAKLTAAGYGATAELSFIVGYPPTINTPQETEFALQVAADLLGTAHVKSDIPPTMGAEDFAFMLEQRPGAYVYIGNGNTAHLHHPAYNFDDETSPVGASYFARIVETAQPLKR